MPPVFIILAPRDRGLNGSRNLSEQKHNFKNHDFWYFFSKKIWKFKLFFLIFRSHFLNIFLVFFQIISTHQTENKVSFHSKWIKNVFRHVSNPKLCFCSEKHKTWKLFLDPVASDRGSIVYYSVGHSWAVACRVFPWHFTPTAWWSDFITLIN